MAKVVISENARGKTAARHYGLTVVFEPLTAVDAGRRNDPKVPRAQNPSLSGYRVTFPLFPGVITYGRTLTEARKMARDAIRCHFEGLQADGEPVLNERN